MSATVIDSDGDPKISHAFSERMRAKKELERRRDNEYLGRITEQLMEGIIMRHTGHTLKELGAAHNVIDRLELGLGAIINAEEVSRQELISERCETVLEHALKMIGLSRPHPYDSDQLKRGKFEFYKRVLEMQKAAIQLLETFTDVNKTTGPEKLKTLMGKLCHVGLMTTDAARDIAERLYPPGSKVLEYKAHLK